MRKPLTSKPGHKSKKVHLHCLRQKLKRLKLYSSDTRKTIINRNVIFMQMENGIGDRVMKTITSFQNLKKMVCNQRNQKKILLSHRLHQPQVLKKEKAQVKGLLTLEFCKILTRQPKSRQSYSFFLSICGLQAHELPINIGEEDLDNYHR